MCVVYTTVIVYCHGMAVWLKKNNSNPGKGQNLVEVTSCKSKNICVAKIFEFNISIFFRTIRT